MPGDGFTRQNCEAVIINVFRDVKETMFKELKENVTIMTHQIETVNKDIEIIFKRSFWNSGVKKENWNEKFTKGSQKQI